MTYTSIRYEKQRKGALITLNRPHALNALNQELTAELDAALREAEADPAVRAVILAGESGVFSTGEDMTASEWETAWPSGIPAGSSLAAEFDKQRDSSRKDILGGQFYRWHYPKPIIAAVSGWCLGAASWLALTCHLTLAAEDAVFAQPQVRHGGGTDFIWVLLAGFKNALRYSLTGDPIDAAEALRIGLVNQVVPKERLLEECFLFVERIARVPPETVKINLHLATAGLEMMGLFKAWTLNAELSAMARLSTREEFSRHLEDAMRAGGASAFFKKRDAGFQPEPFGPGSRKE